MPLYEYQCDVCGHRFEVIQKFSDPPVEKCPVCGGNVHKLQSAPAFQFKGSGWYVTDYAKAGRPESKAESTEGSKAEGKTETKAESKEGSKAESREGAKPESGRTESKDASATASTSDSTKSTKQS